MRVADAGGLVLVGIQDPPYQHHFFGTSSLIPTLFAETKRITFFTGAETPPGVAHRMALISETLQTGDLRGAAR